MSWNLVRHAFSTIFLNFAPALRVSLLPLILAAVIFYVAAKLNGVFDLPLASLTPENALDMLVSLFGLMIIIVPAGLFIFGWIAVGWHRFVLLEEYPGVGPRFQPRLILSYVGKSLLLGLIIFVAAFVVMFVGTMFISIAGSVGMYLTVVAANLLLAWLWFRMALVLPAAALDQKMNIRDSMAHTENLSTTLFGVALTLVLINFALGLLVDVVYAGSIVLGTAVDFGVQWLFIMVGISILTTLYGHLVEGRELPT